MAAVCFECQDYMANIGHETINCPNLVCKNCGQKGHLRMNCMLKSMVKPWFKDKSAKRYIFTHSRFLLQNVKRCIIVTYVFISSILRIRK